MSSKIRDLASYQAESESVKNIAAAFIKTIGVDLFCYHRIYHDGSEFMTSTHATWTEHYLASSYSVVADLEKPWDLHQNQVIIWPFDDENKVLESIKSLFHINQGITLVLDNKTYYEAFGFGKVNGDAKSLNNLINNISKIKQFALEFKKQARDIISQIENYSFTSDVGKSIRQLPKKMQQLSKSEFEIIPLLIEGLSAKEIADRFFVSHRTVECRIASMKDKLLCSSKAELVSRLKSWSI
jgi:DNA-binding CsgD family transcriptional regulator